MRISVWQLSTVVLLSVLIGQSLPTQPREAQAAAKDVFGSPQVAVSSYKNQKGSFILWADGHISNVDTPDQVVSALSDCVEAPEVPAITRDKTKPQGSPNVPVGVYQNAKSTYVLFADGSYKKPKGEAAASIATHTVRAAQVNGDGVNFGDSSLKVTHDSPGYYTINFDPPFDNMPTVAVTPADHHHIAGVMPGSLDKNHCRIWCSLVGGPFGWSDGDCGYSISVVGE
jgi:hypothetical protein